MGAFQLMDRKLVVWRDGGCEALKQLGRAAEL
jgi:hypothetical protein